MSLAGFFRRSRKPVKPRIESLLAAVTGYMAVNAHNDEFFPAVVAAALGESELGVLAVFGELDDEGVVMPVYLTYCVVHSLPLDEFQTRGTIKDPEYCAAGDHDVSSDEQTLRVEVAFRVNRPLLRRRMREAA